MMKFLLHALVLSLLVLLAQQHMPEATGLAVAVYVAGVVFQFLDWVYVAGAAFLLFCLHGTEVREAITSWLT